MTREALHRRAHAFILERADGTRDDAQLDELLRDMRGYQANLVAPYRRLVEHRGGSAALPTDVFRFARVAVHSAAEDRRVFRTSGTTSGRRGSHHFRDLSLYNAAARTAAKRMLFGDVDSMRLVVLAPSEAEAPQSSLSYMLSRFADWFGTKTTWCWSDSPDIGAFTDAIQEATDESIAILATSFALVHLLDETDASFSLPAGSRVMQTGGFKGRSRSVDATVLRTELAQRFAIPETHIVAEYSMTELSSQLYESTLVEPGRPRHLWVPGWTKATVVDPDTLQALPNGEPGILRIDDAANLDSCCAVQTADLAVRTPAGLQLLGRRPGAVPRGCSLSVEEALDAS